MGTRPADALLRVAAAVGLLGVVLLQVALTAPRALAVTAVLGCLAAVVAVVGLLGGGGVEVRLLTAVVAAVSLLLAGVGMALGAPGSGGGGVTPSGVLVIATSLATLGLLWLATTTRSVRGAAPGTYAR